MGHCPNWVGGTLSLHISVPTKKMTCSEWLRNYNKVIKYFRLSSLTKSGVWSIVQCLTHSPTNKTNNVRDPNIQIKKMSEIFLSKIYLYCHPQIPSFVFLHDNWDILVHEWWRKLNFVFKLCCVQLTNLIKNVYPPP